MIKLGKTSGAFGIKGWVKIFSYTSPPEQIFKYQQWYIKQSGQWNPVKLKSGRPQGKGLIAQIDGIADRNAAEALGRCEIAIKREQLPRLREDEFYWSDLIGMQVIDTKGIKFGTVKSMIETGANDVLVVVDGDKERLIPWILEQVIQSVSLQDKQITVDWDPDF